MRKLAWLIAVFALAAHAEVYKWVDEKGNVQYGENPPPGVNATKMSVPGGGPSAPEKSPEKPSDTPGDKASSQQAAGKPMSKDDRTKRCEFEKQQLEVFENDAPVKYWNDKKELVTLEGKARENAKAQIKDNVKKYCS